MKLITEKLINLGFSENENCFEKYIQKIVEEKAMKPYYMYRQKNIIEKYDVIVPVDVHTIEKYGGGSARCMIAELFI